MTDCNPSLPRVIGIAALVALAGAGSREDRGQPAPHCPGAAS